MAISNTTLRTKGYKLSLADKTLTITKAFNDAVASGEGDEYAIYTKLMSEIPGLQVVSLTHSTPRVYKNKDGSKTSRNQFKNLTYENMERFINSIPNNEEYLTEYNFARYPASSLQINGYTLIRRWFVAQFPEYRKNPLFYLRNQPELIPIDTIQKQMAAENAALESNAVA